MEIIGQNSVLKSSGIHGFKRPVIVGFRKLNPTYNSYDDTMLIACKKYLKVCDSLLNLLICYSLVVVVVEATQPWRNKLLFRWQSH